MKKLFSLFAAVLFAGSMMAADEVLFEQTYPGSPSEYTNSYTKTFTLTTGGYTLSYANVNNGQETDNWNAVRAGRKSGNASVATITSGAIAETITKVVVHFTQVDANKTNSLTLEVADANDFANPVSVAQTIAVGDVTFAIASPAANKYYRIVIDQAAGSSNGFNRWDKVSFYKQAADIAATGIELDQTAVTLPQYREVQLVATLTPAGANTAVVWASDNENVEVIDGLVKAKAASGTATITATAGEGVSATCAITLAEAPVLTCADAAAKAASVSANNENYAGGQYVVRGYVTETFTNASFTTEGEYVSFYMDDAEGTARTLEVYKAAWATVAVGDYVEAVGYLTKYNTTNEMAAGGKVTVLPKPIRGAYNVGGANADYASLFAACQDINARGIVGDVELLICANLTEGQNPVLSNPTNYSITIRPNADEDRKIEFTATKDNFGPSGAFCIGSIREVKSGVDTIAWGTALTNNIIIDGYAEGGETRRLTFDTPQGFGSGAGPILFYGDVHNCKLINCIINNSRNAGTTGVTVRTANMAKFDAGTPNYRPENILIENNIIAPRVNGQGIVINGSQASTIGDGAPLGTIIRNNQITASNRGVFFNGVNGLVFEGNELTMNGAAGFNAHGLFGYTQVVGDIIVKDNVFKVNTLQVAAGDFGVIAIGSSGAITGREDDVHWIIDNNYFYGMDALAEATGNFKLMYVRAGSNTTLRHNTFYIPTFTNAVPMDLVAANCAAALYLAGSGAYAAENNIFVCKETASNVSLIRGALNDNIKNNVYHHDGGNAAILAGAVVAADSAAFFAEGANVGSVWKEPVFADAANGDLSITTADADLLMPRLEDILVDITGADRRENTYAGAFEGPEPSPATAIDAVEVQGIQKIFRNGEVLIIRDGKTYNMMGQIVE